MVAPPPDVPTAAAHVRSAFLTVAERTVYFLAALALIAAAAALFVVLALDVITSDTGGVTQTVITVLEQMLLVFILLELAHSVHIVLREQTLVAGPFLIIGPGRIDDWRSRSPWPSTSCGRTTDPIAAGGARGTLRATAPPALSRA